MYRPKMFDVDDITEQHAIMRDHGFAQLTTGGPQGLVATHLPLHLLDGGDRATGCFLNTLPMRMRLGPDTTPTSLALVADGRDVAVAAGADGSERLEEMSDIRELRTGEQQGYARIGGRGNIGSGGTEQEVICAVAVQVLPDERRTKLVTADKGRRPDRSRADHTPVAVAQGEQQHKAGLGGIPRCPNSQAEARI